jgi:hypothetical protein
VSPFHKAILSIIWVLSVLLLVATLDSYPDPPANNPCIAQSKLSSLHRSLEVTPSVPFVDRLRDYPLNSLIVESHVAPARYGLSRLIGQVADRPPPLSPIADLNCLHQG